MKITDTTYRLPTIEALNAFGVMESGTTQPMKIRGVDMETGLKDNYVVKFVHGNRMSERASALELLGAWMATELDLPVIEPVLIHISQAFTNTISGSGYQAALKSIGLNFGSRFQEGFSMLVKSPSLISNHLEWSAVDIFAFDQFISNADRSHKPEQKPNVLSDGNRFLLLDHELAFSFVSLLPFLRNKTPWIPGALEREMIEGHIFYKYLRQKEYDFKPFVEKLCCFDAYFWERVRTFMPDSWKGNFLQDIQSYLDPIIENREIFAEQLTILLLP